MYIVVYRNLSDYLRKCGNTSRLAMQDQLKKLKSLVKAVYNIPSCGEGWWQNLSKFTTLSQHLLLLPFQI